MFTKKLIILFFPLFIIAELSFGCNGGCPSGGGYLGIVPQFSKNFIGVRYRLRTFSSSDHHDNNTPDTKHYFETMELWGRFYPSKRVQVFVFLPFQMNTEKTNNSTSYIQNVGDFSFIANYNLINTGDSLGRNWKHNLLVGVGAKLPTGKYQQRDVTKQMYPIVFQSGTGAYSGIFSAMYTLRHNKMGINTNVSYYYNGKNELNYSFGNLLAGSASLFYWLKIGSVSILPNVGSYFENTQRDIENNYYVHDTGGTLGYYSIGTDVYVSRFAISLNVQTPYLQDLPQRTQTNDWRTMASVSVLF